MFSKKTKTNFTHPAYLAIKNSNLNALKSIMGRGTDSNLMTALRVGILEFYENLSTEIIFECLFYLELDSKLTKVIEERRKIDSNLDRLVNLLPFIKQATFRNHPEQITKYKIFAFIQKLMLVYKQQSKIFFNQNKEADDILKLIKQDKNFQEIKREMEKQKSNISEKSVLYKNLLDFITDEYWFYFVLSTTVNVASPKPTFSDEVAYSINSEDPLVVWDFFLSQPNQTSEKNGYFAKKELPSLLNRDFDFEKDALIPFCAFVYNRFDETVFFYAHVLANDIGNIDSILQDEKKSEAIKKNILEVIEIITLQGKIPNYPILELLPIFKNNIETLNKLYALCETDLSNDIDKQLIAAILFNQPFTNINWKESKEKNLIVTLAAQLERTYILDKIDTLDEDFFLHLGAAILAKEESTINYPTSLSIVEGANLIAQGIMHYVKGTSTENNISKEVNKLLDNNYKYPLEIAVAALGFVAEQKAYETFEAMLKFLKNTNIFNGKISLGYKEDFLQRCVYYFSGHRKENQINEFIAIIEQLVISTPIDSKTFIRLCGYNEKRMSSPQKDRLYRLCVHILISEKTPLSFLDFFDKLTHDDFPAFCHIFKLYPGDKEKKKELFMECVQRAEQKKLYYPYGFKVRNIEDLLWENCKELGVTLDREVCSFTLI